jgi:hypothetical protein
MIEPGTIGLAAAMAAPLGGFLVARRAGGRRIATALVLAAVAGLVLWALYAFRQAEHWGALQGLGWTLGGILALAFAHLALAGLAAGRMAPRIAVTWRRRVLDIGLALAGYATVLAWPQVD